MQNDECRIIFIIISCEDVFNMLIIVGSVKSLLIASESVLSFRCDF